MNFVQYIGARMGCGDIHLILVQLDKYTEAVSLEYMNFQVCSSNRDSEMSIRFNPLNVT